MQTQTTVTAPAARNADVLRAGFAAFGRGDMPALQEIFAPDSVWHTLRPGQLGGTHEGWPAVAEFFGHSVALTQGTFRAEILEVLANENGAAAVVRATGRRADGRSFDSRQIVHFRIDEGKVLEAWQFIDDAVAAAEFWS